MSPATEPTVCRRNECSRVSGYSCGDGGGALTRDADTNETTPAGFIYTITSLKLCANNARCHLCAQRRTHTRAHVCAFVYFRESKFTQRLQALRSLKFVYDSDLYHELCRLEFHRHLPWI